MTQKDIIEKFDEVVDKTKVYFSSLNVISNETSKAYILSYFATIINYSNAISSLLKSNNLIAIPPIFRSLVEAHVDLINLCRHDDYYNVLYFQSLQNKIRMLQKTFDNKENPFFYDTINNLENRESKIKEYRKERDAIRKKIQKFGKNITAISNRFELAGISEVHSSVYKLQSQEIHNDLQVVDDRHLEMNNGILSVNLNKNLQPFDFSSQVITTISILKMSVKDIMLTFDLNKNEYLVKELEKIEDLFIDYFENKYR